MPSHQLASSEQSKIRSRNRHSHRARKLRLHETHHLSTEHKYNRGRPDADDNRLYDLKSLPGVVAGRSALYHHDATPFFNTMRETLNVSAELILPDTVFPRLVLCLRTT